jgi:hypothetical protein
LAASVAQTKVSHDLGQLSDYVAADDHLFRKSSLMPDLSLSKAIAQGKALAGKRCNPRHLLLCARGRYRWRS